MMDLAVDVAVVGVNHRTAPVSVRERVTIRPEEHQSLIQHLRKHAQEVVVLATCNRTEIYLAGIQGDPLSAFEGAWGQSLRPYLYFEQGRRALHHLYQVASGLDSLVLGETQILGQVKRAWQEAHTAGHTASLLNRAFQSTLAIGKRVRSLTGISDSAVSVSYAAVSLAEAILGDLHGKTAMVVGAGETAELTMTHLRARGIAQVFVVNRTIERAQKLAEQWGGHACAVETLNQVLPQTDVVIASAAAPHYVIQPQRVQQALQDRPNHPMFLIDISLPRIIDPAVAQVDGAYLYNLDDLTRIVQKNLAVRSAKVPQAEMLIAEAIGEYLHWHHGHLQRQLLQHSQQHADTVVTEELQRLLRRCPELADQQDILLETLRRLSARVHAPQLSQYIYASKP